MLNHFYDSFIPYNYSLKSFLSICETVVGTPPGIPLAPLNVMAVKINVSLEQIQAQLKDITSKTNFTS